MKRLTDRVAIVTGAAGGIGAATVERLVAEGARVVAADIDIAAASAVAVRVGGQCIAIAFDAADTASIENLVIATVARFGRLDILHNNAALTGQDIMDIDLATVDVPFDFWDRTMAVNLKAYFAACKFAIPHMLANGGSIINMSSTAGLTGDLVRTAYSASKAGIASLTRSVAIQYGRQRIRCNAIAPGMIATQNAWDSAPDLLRGLQRHIMTPDAGRPEDVAALVAFLASDDARFITAQTITIDGGMMSHPPHVADLL